MEYEGAEKKLRQLMLQLEAKESEATRMAERIRLSDGRPSPELRAAVYLVRMAQRDLKALKTEINNLMREYRMGSEDIVGGEE